MDRSLYPPRVEVRSDDLQNTETTKVFHLLKRFTDTNQTGVVTSDEYPGTVTQGTTLSTINVAACEGYTPNGELVQTVATFAQALATLETGVPNLVGFMYQEVRQRPGAHELDGTSQNKEAVRTYEYRSFTQAEYLALPETEDDDLDADSQDRFLVVAVVEVTSLVGQAVVLDITGPTDVTSYLTIEQPSNITGVTITALSDDTPESDPSPATGTVSPARLSYSSLGLTYRAPGDLSFGAPVLLTGSPSAEGISIPSDSGPTLTISYNRSALPRGSIPFAPVDDLLVSRLYARTSSRAGARDEEHRSHLGTVPVSDSNSHGFQLSDMSALLQRLLGTLVPGAGLKQTLRSLEIPDVVSAPHAAVTAGSGQRDLLWEGAVNDGLVAGDQIAIRAYRNDFSTLELTANAFWNLLTLEWEADTASGTAAAKLELAGNLLTLHVHQSASLGSSWADSAWDNRMWSQDNTAFRATGAGSLTLGTELLTTLSQAIQSRLNVDYSNAVTRTLLFESRNASVTGGSILRVYRGAALPGVTSATHFLEITFNSFWTGSSPAWTRDAGEDAHRYVITGNKLLKNTHPSASTPTWQDVVGTGDWENSGVNVDSPIYPSAASAYDLGTSLLPWQNMYAGQYVYSPTRTSYKTIPAARMVQTRDDAHNTPEGQIFLQPVDRDDSGGGPAGGGGGGGDYDTWVLTRPGAYENRIATPGGSPIEVIAYNNDTNREAVTLWLPFALPHNVILTSITMYAWLDFSLGGTAKMTAYRVPVTGLGTPTQLVRESIQLSGPNFTSAPGGYQLQAPKVMNPAGLLNTINNRDFLYWIALTGDNPASDNMNLEVVSFTFEYEVQQALP